MKKYKIDAIPFSHPDLSTWRDDHYRYIGASVLHDKTNFLVTGIIDDIWKDTKDNLLIVDYKATSTSKEISLEDKWKQGYKRQMEIYQWLFRKNGFKVSDTGYFVYCNGKTDIEAFDAKLEFDIKLIPYKGDTSWVEGTIKDAIECLQADKLPESGKDCDFCKYRQSVRQHEE